MEAVSSSEMLMTLYCTVQLYSLADSRCFRWIMTPWIV